MTIHIKKLNKQHLDEFQSLIGVFAEVFEMESFTLPSKKYLQTLIAKEDFFVLVAMLDVKVVGGLTAYTLKQYYSEKPLVYIYDLAVLNQYQRQGIGKMLIKELTGFCKGIGVEEIFVQADSADQHAIEFYQASGGSAQHVVNFNYPLNS